MTSITKYLPLYINSKALYSQSFVDDKVGAWTVPVKLTDARYCSLVSDRSVSRIRLHIRKLSSMTEDEKIHLFKLAFGEEHTFNKFGFDPIEEILLADQDGRTRCAVSLKSMPVDGVDYLRSQGIWLGSDSYFDKGLIIDSKTLNKEV